MLIVVQHPKKYHINPFQWRKVIFHGILTHLKNQIFTPTTTFYRITIRNHDLKFINMMDMTMNLFRNMEMHEIMDDDIVD